MTFRERFRRDREEAGFPGRLADIAGWCGDAGAVVVTDRGVEIPIGEAPDDWSVAEFTRLLAQINRWPETEHPLGAHA